MDAPHRTNLLIVHPPLKNWSLLVRLLPTRRTYVKVIHLLMIPLTFWFMIATPSFVFNTLGPKGAAMNSDIALIFVTLALIWTIDFMIRGLAGKAGPKLSPRLKRFHQILHKTLMYLLFLVPVGGFLIGLTANRTLFAGGWLPIAPHQNWPEIHKVVGKLHIYEFYILGAVVAIHASFHVWRHIVLKDNTLRIMTPKFLHRFL